MIKDARKGLASVVVVNYNGAHLLEECLDSLLVQTYRDIELILVDNGSSDNSCKLVKEKYASRIKLIKNNNNTGFAQGNNIGIEESSGEFIILVNNDTKTDRECIEQLILAARTEDKIGMCAAKLLNYYNPRIIDGTGHLIYKDGLSQARGRFEIDIGQYETIDETISPPGCGALYKRKMLNEVGLFDSDFFAYVEDTDLGLRARMMNWKAIYVPKAIIYHKISQTGGQYSSIKLYFTERNRLCIIFKCYPVSFLMSTIFYTGLRYTLQLVSVFKNKGAAKKFINKISLPATIIILFSAYFSFLIKIPGLFTKRRGLMHKRKINNKEFLDLFKKFGINARKLVYND
ncbi:MAG: glycosyltransferase family 2 protein [Candidatus Omnitrophica bacterium]|nr:glycosyltransferase family 2 protein [Candidatus Omnitrophota bacterium]